MFRARFFRFSPFLCISSANLINCHITVSLCFYMIVKHDLSQLIRVAFLTRYVTDIAMIILIIDIAMIILITTLFTCYFLKSILIMRFIFLQVAIFSDTCMLTVVNVYIIFQSPLVKFIVVCMCYPNR
jgi:hypothetical protein